MGAILCIIGDQLCQEWQKSSLEFQNNKQEWQENNLECERVDQELENYMNTFYKQGKFDYETYEEMEDVVYPYINLKKRGGQLYINSLIKMADWAVSNCVEDQLPKAMEMKNKIEKVSLSCQEDNFDPEAYPRLVGNYRADINRLLSNYLPSWSFHFYPTDFNTQMEGQKPLKPCMICDNPQKPESMVNGCFNCSENMCYCRCNLCKKCYCTCQMCNKSHPTSMCIYLSDSESFEDDTDTQDVDSDDSVSSGCHTDSNSDNSVKYSDLSMNITITLGEQPTDTDAETLGDHPFILDLLNITKNLVNDERPTSVECQDINKEADNLEVTPTDNTTYNVKPTDNITQQMEHVQTQTEGKILIVDHGELEILEKVHILNSYLNGTAINN